MNDTNSCYILFILLCLREIEIKNTILVFTYYLFYYLLANKVQQTMDRTESLLYDIISQRLFARM